MGQLRPYLDKAILADSYGICTTELLVLRAREGVDPRYLALIVHTKKFIEFAVAGTTGAQHPLTSWNHISQFELPDFPNYEQSQIADIGWLIYNSIQACDHTFTATFDLKRAAMRELFTRGLRGEAQKETEIGPVPESWAIFNLGSLCNTNDGCIQTGPFGSQLHANE